MNWVISVPIPELEGSKQILMGTLKLIIYIIMWLIHIAHLLRQYFRLCRLGSREAGVKNVPIYVLTFQASLRI